MSFRCQNTFRFEQAQQPYLTTLAIITLDNPNRNNLLTINHLMNASAQTPQKVFRNYHEQQMSSQKELQNEGNHYPIKTDFQENGRRVGDSENKIMWFY